MSGTNEFIETYALPDAYTERTEGTFVWNCGELPFLSVSVSVVNENDKLTG